MIRVLGLGDNVCDVYLHTGIMYPGGQALNFAVYAASLGAQADYMGVFGSDAVAAHVKAVLDRKQIGRSHCRTFEGENGYARVTLKDGDRTFRGSNRGGVLQTHPIFLDAEDLSYDAGFDVIYTTNNGFTDGLRQPDDDHFAGKQRHFPVRRLVYRQLCYQGYYGGTR